MDMFTKLFARANPYRFVTCGVVAVVLVMAAGTMSRADEPSDVAKVQNVLNQAIDKGVPLFNDGDASGCYRIYQQALSSVLPMLGSRPALKAAVQAAISNAGQQRSDTGKAAWTLRRAIDMMQAVLADPGVSPGKELPPKSWPKATYTDVDQGGAPTCWILGTIASLEYNGARLQNRITFLGNNYYSVSMYNFKNAHDRRGGGTTKELEFVYFDGATTAADPHYDPKDPHQGWVVIMQRAVVQAVSDWDPSESVANPHGGDTSDAFGIMTGKAPVQFLPVQDAGTQNKVLAALAAHKTVTFGSSGSAKTLVAGHTYGVIGSNNQGVILYNPWGSSATVSWSTLKQEGDGFFIN
jgi:hypothetical protein